MRYSLGLHDTMGAVEAVDEVRRGRAARERQPVPDDHGLLAGRPVYVISVDRCPVV